MIHLRIALHCGISQDGDVLQFTPIFSILCSRPFRLQCRSTEFKQVVPVEMGGSRILYSLAVDAESTKEELRQARAVIAGPVDGMVPATVHYRYRKWNPAP